MEVKVMITAGAKEKDFTAAAAKIRSGMADVLAGRQGPAEPFEFTEAGPAITMLAQLCLPLMDMNRIDERKVPLDVHPDIEAVIRNYVGKGIWTGCWCINCAGSWLAAMASYTIGLLEQIHGDKADAAAAWNSLMDGVFPAVRMLGARSIPAR